MVIRLEHVGIAVRDLEAANEVYTKLLGIAPYKEENVDSEHVKTSFFRTGESKIELLEATSPDSAIAKSIGRRGEGLHHLAFEVDDIELETERLIQEGFRALGESAKRGADRKLVRFFHPKDANGVLVELCQTLPEA